MVRKVHPYEDRGVRVQINKEPKTREERLRYKGRKELLTRLISLGVCPNRALVRAINFDPLADTSKKQRRSHKRNNKQKGTNARKRNKGSNALGRSRSKK
jgi:hypothetical protein